MTVSDCVSLSPKGGGGAGSPPSKSATVIYRKVRINVVWLGGAVVRALDLRLEVAGSILAAALSSATSDKLFTHFVQRLWCYNLMALYKSV